MRPKVAFGAFNAPKAALGRISRAGPRRAATGSPSTMDIGRPRPRTPSPECPMRTGSGSGGARRARPAALHAFGQSLAVSLAPRGISVTSVAPGFTATERVADRIDDALRAPSPFGRVGTPEEVAAAVVYLASADAAWASVAILDLNGASHLRM